MVANVTFPVNRRIKDQVPVPNPSDLTSLSADTLMTLIEDALSGTFGLRCQCYDTYNDLYANAKDAGRLYYCVEDETYYGFTPSKGLVVIG